jgi:hypothetical protein
MEQRFPTEFQHFEGPCLLRIVPKLIGEREEPGAGDTRAASELPAYDATNCEARGK